MRTTRRFRFLPLLAALAFAFGPLTADSNVTNDAYLPLVHIVGLTGTWQTDVSVFNPGSTPARVTFYFTPADTDGTNANGYRLTPDLQPRETVTITDMLRNTFNVPSGYGVLEVVGGTKDAPMQILVTSNTVNVAANCTGGTFGQFSPGQPERNAVGFGQTNDYDLYVPGIVNDQNHLTSAAVMNPSNATLYATLQLVDGAGNTWDSVEAVVPPYSMHQFSDVFGSVFASVHPPADNSWRLNFYVSRNTGATLLGYATITDRRSGDPYLITAQAQVVNVPLLRAPADGSVRRAPAPYAASEGIIGPVSRGEPLVQPAPARR